MGRRPGKHFSKADIQTADRYMQRCSASLINREVQTQTAMRYHLAPVRAVFIKKDDKCPHGCGEKRPLPTVGANVSGAAAMENHRKGHSKD